MDNPCRSFLKPSTSHTILAFSSSLRRAVSYSNFLCSSDPSAVVERCGVWAPVPHGPRLPLTKRYPSLLRITVRLRAVRFSYGFKRPCLALRHSVLISNGTDYLLARLVKSVHKLEAHKALSKGLKNTSEVTV